MYLVGDLIKYRMRGKNWPHMQSHGLFILMGYRTVNRLAGRAVEMHNLFWQMSRVSLQSLAKVI